MPIFEYKCKKCKNEFEYFIMSSNQDGPVCPKCYSNEVDKQISGSSFRLKGSGWADQGYSKGGE